MVTFRASIVSVTSYQQESSEQSDGANATVESNYLFNIKEGLILMGKQSQPKASDERETETDRRG